MHDLTLDDRATRQLSCGLVLRVHEDSCEVLTAQQVCSVQYAPMFPTPRTERVSPGHLVAMTTTPNGVKTVLWRWYDAVVLGDEEGSVRLWEPAHGEVLAQPRPTYRPGLRGTRAYMSAGLPGAEWWVAGAVAADTASADVELEAVGDLYTEHGLWDSIT